MLCIFMGAGQLSGQILISRFNYTMLYKQREHIIMIGTAAHCNTKEQADNTIIISGLKKKNPKDGSLANNGSGDSDPGHVFLRM